MSCKKESKDNAQEKSFSILIEHSKDILNYNKIHRNNTVEVLYVIDGEIDIIIDFMPCKIKKGDCVFINSNVYHAILCSGKSDFEFLSWSFLPEHIYAYGNDIYNVELFLWLAIKTRNTYSIINTADFPKIPKLFLKAMERFSEKKYGYEFALHADTLSLCIDFFDNWHEENSDFIMEISGMSISKIKNVLFNIEKNYDNLSFDEFAKNVDVLQGTFPKNFKRVTGYNVSEYIDRCRIEKAMFLLAATTKPITDVAFSVGYSDSSYFSKRFHAYVGMSPSKFRKTNTVKAFFETAE